MKMGTNSRVGKLVSVAVVFVVAMSAAFWMRSVNSGEAAAAPGTLRIVLALEGGQQQGQGRLAMHLINDGPGSANVMTGNLQPATQMSDKGDGRIFIVFRSAPELFYDGRRVALSEVDLRPVSLLANEEVLLQDISPLLRQLPEGKVQIAVAYEIEPGLAKRYNLWSGRVESNAIELTVNR